MFCHTLGCPALVPGTLPSRQVLSLEDLPHSVAFKVHLECTKDPAGDGDQLQKPITHFFYWNTKACTKCDPSQGGLSAHWAGRYALQMAPRIVGVHQQRAEVYVWFTVCGCLEFFIYLANYCDSLFSGSILIARSRSCRLLPASCKASGTGSRTCMGFPACV